MLDLCIDVGNSTFMVGIYDKRKLIKRDFFLVNDGLDKKQYRDNFLSLLAKQDVEIINIGRVIYSSVVPSIDEKILPQLKEIFACSILKVKEQKIDLNLGQVDINELGDDLIADLLGAKKKYGYPCIIADLGTASKILLLDKNGIFDTCLIIPGLSMSVDCLSKKAALLPDISINTPSTILAHNTVEAMNAGVVFGHVEMLKGLVKRIENEIGYPCLKILTGGSAIYVKSLLNDEFVHDNDLCLDGLKEILGD